MYWIEKILPSCCSNRPSSNQNPSKSPSSFLPQINVICESSDLPDSQEESKTQKPKASTQSRRSTNYTINSSDLSSIMIGNLYSETLACAICSNPAKGFCPSCPNLRYCQSYYNQTHKKTSKFHKFISYSYKKPCEVNKLIKIKSLCE